jgi:hypothetical protein
MRVSSKELLADEVGNYCIPDNVKREIEKLTENNYLVFFYLYNDTYSKITDIVNVTIVPNIVLSLYKNVPSSKGIPYSLGYFQAPFDTQNVLFFQFLKFYFYYPTKVNRVEILLNYFLDAKKKDTESVKYKLEKTIYNNVFNIFTRDNLFTALNRFIIASNEVVSSVIAICDTVDTYLKIIKDKSFYVDYLSKVVMGIRNPNGGLIPETTNKLRYLYVGEKSVILGGEDLLVQAKEMFRNKFSINEIYIKTGWHYNKYDFLWRKAIYDEETDIPSIPINTMFMKTESKFANRSKEIFAYMDSGDSDKITELLNDGWDIYLSDVLKHDTLYKHFPQLFKLPIFYAVNSKSLDKSNAYSFYYNPTQNYIMIIGNAEYFDIKTTLLHETQHAIQNIEGFGTGGNQFLAKMIQAVGGENVKEYFYIRQSIETEFLSGAKREGVFSYEKYSSMVRKTWECDTRLEKLLPKIKSENTYYDNIKEVAQKIVSVYINNINDKSREEIQIFLGADITKQFEKIYGFVKSSTTVANRMLGQGYTQQQVHKIFFDTYESLLGEIESRDVAHISKLDKKIRDYLLPMTSESIEEKKITVIYDEFMVDEKIPKKIRGAVEQNSDGKYIIHLLESASAEPMLHELGHIVGDIIGRSYIELTISNSFDINTIDSFGGLQEVFSELFLCYLVRQKLSIELNDDIDRDRKLMDKTIFDKQLNDIFYPKEQVVGDKDFMMRIEFMKKMDKLVDEL